MPSGIGFKRFSTNCQNEIELNDRVRTQHWTAGKRSG